MTYILYFIVCILYWCNKHCYVLLCTGQLLVHSVPCPFSFGMFLYSFVSFSLHYVNGINKVMMMMMMMT